MSKGSLMLMMVRFLLLMLRTPCRQWVGLWMVLGSPPRW